MGKVVKKGPKANQAESMDARDVDVPVVEPKRPKKQLKRDREIEVRLKIPGYVPVAARVVNIDRLDAAGRAKLLDELIDQLVQQF